MFLAWTNTCRKCKYLRPPLEERFVPACYVVVHAHISLLFPTFTVIKLTSSILVAQIWEPPHVSQADDLPSDSQEELEFVGPLSSGGDAGSRMGRLCIKSELHLWTIHFTAKTGKNYVYKGDLE